MSLLSFYYDTHTYDNMATDLKYDVQPRRRALDHPFLNFLQHRWKKSWMKAPSARQRSLAADILPLPIPFSLGVWVERRGVSHTLSP